MTRRWLFADQLGPHFLDEPDQPVLLVESRRVFARRRFHRQKAHLVLSALRHRAAELGDQAVFVQDDGYGPAVRAQRERVSVCHPTTRPALRLVQELGVEVLPARGFATEQQQFARWAGGHGSLLMEAFYRDARRRLGVLMEPDGPVGGTWNYDHDNREPPPADGLHLDEPWWPEEDEIDEQVRADLDRWEREGTARFVGRDGPRRFAATRAEALAALDHFVERRLPTFGPTEDAMLRRDWTMSHSLLSATMNLGLLDPMECVRRAEAAYRSGAAPLASVEGYVRQLIGWRDYVYGTYWWFGPDYPGANALGATTPLPDWFRELDADAVEAACLRDVLAGVRDRGWVHHIPRLMVLGNYALQRGWSPQELTAWFHECFVDGYEWVMVANIIGMSQHADGGAMATKPYASGGAYINRMSDYCKPCAYDPKVRVGPTACPFTAGYWAFLDRTQPLLAANPRMSRPLLGLARLSDREALVEQERARGSAPP
ncbi:deoxyribodipyrimidine photolyase-related protein [Motilibacter peucedani]|uniref:Deoxyribodipyrimidine photolyase-related protein n=1 Tax=Motilibacter peucedani TaxID=598650 RepID=A0A420XLX9_9ACTN|nr:cryptochrome/photolyase family protein [Motilibacter peucedani]RKS71527.1 deoxyribodipyrimidine photolyase-related protein [Motilibacter peucedani]